MEIKDILKDSLVKIPLSGTSKSTVILEMIELLANDGQIKDQQLFLAAVEEREKQGITGMGGGIAIPHGQSATVQQPAVAIGLTKVPIQWESYDQEPVDVIVMLAIPEGKEGSQSHLTLLAKLSTKLADPSRVQRIRSVENYSDLKEQLIY